MPERPVNSLWRKTSSNRAAIRPPSAAVNAAKRGWLESASSARCRSLALRNCPLK